MDTDLLLYEISTENGIRYWHADNESHAVEQHEESIPDEEIIEVIYRGLSPYDPAVFEAN